MSAVTLGSPSPCKLTWDESTFAKTEQNSSRQVRGIGLDKGLEGGDKTPGEELTCQPHPGPQALHDQVGGNLCNHNGSAHELSADVDLICVDVQVFGDGRGQNSADISTVHLESEESQGQDRNEGPIDSAMDYSG